MRGRLRVNVDPFFSRLVLSRELARFLAAHRELRLELIMRDQIGDLVADGFDMALRFGSPPVMGFFARKLLESRILTVASPAYLAAHGRPAHPRDLLDHACIDYQDPLTGRPFAWEFRRGRRVLPVAPAGPADGVGRRDDDRCLLRRSGHRPGHATRYPHILAQGRLVEIFPDWPGETFPLYAIYPSRQHRAAKVRVFTEWCLTLLGGENELDAAATR